jgi:hypothetical protein
MVRRKSRCFKTAKSTIDDLDFRYSEAKKMTGKKIAGLMPYVTALLPSPYIHVGVKGSI